MFEYAFYCGEVTSNLNNAVWQFEQDHNKQFTEQDRNELNEIEETLIDAKMNEIDESIELISNVFRRHGLIA